MATYRIKRFSLSKEDYKNIGRGVKNGALAGSGFGIIAGGPFAEKSLKIPAVTIAGGALIGGALGGWSLYKDIKLQGLYHKDYEDRKKIQDSIEEPDSFSLLVLKYPKIKEISVFHLYNKEFWKASHVLDQYRVMLDYSDFICDLSDESNMYSSTALVRLKTGLDYWISCVGLNLCYNTKDNSWYNVDIYSHKQKKTTVSEYKKQIIKDIDYCILEWMENNSTNKLPSELQNTIDFIRKTLK